MSDLFGSEELTCSDGLFRYIRNIRFKEIIMKLSEHCPGGFVTRQMLKDITGITESKLKKLEGQGKLKSVKRNNYGWSLYNEDMVEEIQNFLLQEQHWEKKKVKFIPPVADKNKYVYAKEDALNVFEMLENSISLIKIVFKLKIHPKILMTIVQDYCELNGSIFLSKESMDEINKLPFDGVLPIKNASEICQILESFANEQFCKKCGKKEKMFCGPCGKAIALSILKKQKEKPEVELPTTDSDKKDESDAA